MTLATKIKRHKVLKAHIGSDHEKGIPEVRDWIFSQLEWTNYGERYIPTLRQLFPYEEQFCLYWRGHLSCKFIFIWTWNSCTQNVLDENFRKILCPDEVLICIIVVGIFTNNNRNRGIRCTSRLYCSNFRDDDNILMYVFNGGLDETSIKHI